MLVTGRRVTRFLERANIRRRLLVPASIGFASFCTGCLMPPTASQSVVANPNDSPDPALAPDVANTHYAFIYGTDSGFSHIPACLTVPGTSTSICGSDALPTPPIQNYPPASGQADLTWAPTVRYINGEYLMMFSESISSDPGRGNCIGAAISSTGSNFSPINTWTMCSGTRYVGFLDPYLFSDPSSGNTYLLYSRQWCAGASNPQQGCTSSPQSEIDSVQINPSAIESGAAHCPFPVPNCGYIGSSPYQMATFQQLSAYGPTDTNSYVENPAIVKDPNNGYDLVMSYGHWSQPNYETIEIPCLLPYGECLPNSGAVLLSQNGGSITGPGPAYNSPGGMSFLFDGSPTANVAIWHSYEFPGNPTNTTREDWTGPTSDWDPVGVANPTGPINGPTPTPFLKFNPGASHVRPATTNYPGIVKDYWQLRGTGPDGGGTTGQEPTSTEWAP